MSPDMAITTACMTIPARLGLVCITFQAVSQTMTTLSMENWNYLIRASGLTCLVERDYSADVTSLNQCQD